MADAPPVAYDEVAEVYSRTVDPTGAGLDDPVLMELIGEVGGQRVLSLACGQGQDARLLGSLGASVTGIDLSDEMLRFARRHEAADPRGITYVQGDAQELAMFAEASFDGVSCHMALMDIPQLAPTIRSVSRVLESGGWFVFSIVHPCFRSHVAILDDYLADHRYLKVEPVDWLPRHAYHRPISDYVNELAGAGFRLTRMAEAHHSATANPGDVPGLLYVRAVKQPS
jgi:ubiquinone/menaquinone biosynthesis C-methylase UbiE